MTQHENALNAKINVKFVTVLKLLNAEQILRALMGPIITVL